MRGNKSRGTGRSLGFGMGGYGDRSGVCRFENQGPPRQPGRAMNQQERLSRPAGNARKPIRPAGQLGPDDNFSLSRRIDENTKKIEAILEKLEALTTRQG